MSNVGYRYLTERGQVGEPGLFYDYVVAANGVFICAENPLLRATVQLAEASIRGLRPMFNAVYLKHGKIPGALYHLATSIFMADRHREQYLAVVWDGVYHLKTPQQTGDATTVHYEKVPNTILEFHSHGEMGAFFSGIDNQDEQGFCLYAVMGDLERLIPDVEMRIGAYGYFNEVRLSEVFSDV
jgi:PRTRC genetic system protein A